MQADKKLRVEGLNGNMGGAERRRMQAAPGWCPLECAVPKRFRIRRTVPNRNLCKLLECAGLIAPKRGPGRPRKVRLEGPQALGPGGLVYACPQGSLQSNVASYMPHLSREQLLQQKELLGLEVSVAAGIDKSLVQQHCVGLKDSCDGLVMLAPLAHGQRVSAYERSVRPNPEIHFILPDCAGLQLGIV